jgi:Mrp family chromosome partitioning ATPase
VRDQFDYIIIDAPPLGMVADAAAMAPFCDGSILLLEAGRIPYRMAQNVASKLKNTNCPILGVILNKVGHSKNGKYSGYYGGYYGGYYKKYSEYY